MKKNIQIVDDAKQAAKTMAIYIKEKAVEKKKKNEHFFIALSGGNTPTLLFEMLGGQFKSSIPWDIIYFYWVDERCVAPENKESNYGIFKSLMPRDIHTERMVGESNPIDEAVRYSELLYSQLPSKNAIPCFDLVLLGMGDDGHTASIFPNQLHLLASENLCEVAEHPISKQKRVTLTTKVINNAQEVVFLVSNDNKSKIVSEILHEENNYLQYPAAHIQPKSEELRWLLDKAAAYLYEKYYFC